MTNAQKMNLVKENLFPNSTDTDYFVADKVYNSFNKFKNSKELKDIYDGFQADTFVKEESFDIAYVVDNKLYVIYKADGLRFLNRETLHTSIDSAGLHYVCGFPFGFLIDRTKAYSKCEKNRKIWRKSQALLTSVYTN